eukprot:7323845-Alexandrium_andersonii.AAC.1
MPGRPVLFKGLEEIGRQSDGTKPGLHCPSPIGAEPGNWQKQVPRPDQRREPVIAGCLNTTSARCLLYTSPSPRD